MSEDRQGPGTMEKKLRDVSGLHTRIALVVEEFLDAHPYQMLGAERAAALPGAAGESLRQAKAWIAMKEAIGWKNPLT